jgi:flagellar motility protein MotE (MotC chaperone)
MLKYLAVICGCVCMAIVLTEVAALGLLWRRGLLTAQTLRELQSVISPETSPAGASGEPESMAPPLPSTEEVAQARAARVLGFDRRADELGALKQWVSEERDALARERAAFLEMRREFLEQRRAVEESLAAEALDKARGILAAMKPKETVAHLMHLPLEENVRLLRGMPEGTVARILKAFADTAEGAAPKTLASGRESPADRGNEIFEALEQGEPDRFLLERNQPAGRTASRQANEHDRK